VRHRTLRGAGTGQTVPVTSRTEINVVLYLSPFRAPSGHLNCVLWPARPSGSLGRNSRYPDYTRYIFGFLFTKRL
jgi:hypothetical protein